MKRKAYIEIECGDVYCHPCDLYKEAVEDRCIKCFRCRVHRKDLTVLIEGPFTHVMRCEECRKAVQIAEDLNNAALIAAIHTPGAIQMDGEPSTIKFITTSKEKL